jgi:hypothetical protein
MINERGPINSIGTDRRRTAMSNDDHEKPYTYDDLLAALDSLVAKGLIEWFIDANGDRRYRATQPSDRRNTGRSQRGSHPSRRGFDREEKR